MKTKFQYRPTAALTTLSATAGTKTLKLSLIAATLLALGAIASPARADNPYVDRGGWRQDSHGIDRGGWRQDSYGVDRGGWRQDNREIRHARRELRADYRELAEDRADYRRAMARGDVAAMHRERGEIRHDIREIRHDRAELRVLRNARHDRHDRRHDYTGWQVPLSIHWYVGGVW